MIGEGSLTYKILIFKFTVYKKEVTYQQIDRIKFKLDGLGKKSAIVKHSKGMNFHISRFYPEEIYDDLFVFAEKHNIPILKTKDYMILEKW